MKIGIAGCGIGGLSAGALLSKQGHNVTLFDRFDQPSPVGSGLMVQPVGQDILRKIGAYEDALAMGAKISNMRGDEVNRGRRVLNVSYGDNYGLGIHRASLFHALHAAAVQSGCVICPSSDVVSTHLSPGGRTVTLNTGETLGPFDLVIDAAGAGSPLSPIKRKPIAYGAIWATVDWPSDSPLPRTHLSQSYQSATKMAGILPLGNLPGSETPKAAVFWSMRQNDYTAWTQSDFAAWQAETVAFWPDFAPFIQQTTRHEDFTMARYSHGTLFRPYAERLVHIGDSAHCTSPQLGQGANMAMLDAYALARMLAAYPMDRALPAYARSRRLHVWLYQMMSQTLTPMYQSDSKLMPWLRDWILAPISSLRPFRWLLSRVGSGQFVPPFSRLPRE